LIAIGLSSLVIFLLMNLVGYAGVKTGVPYPVLARASFGIWGANLPALVRAVVACFWYGAQTAAASGAIVALLTRSDAIMAFHKSTHLLGHSGLEVICYVVVWALQLLIIQNGMETVRKFQDWAGPAVWIAMLVLAVGLCVKAGGFSFDHGIPQDVLLAKTKDAGVPGEPGSFWALMAVGATWITYFAALYLNFLRLLALRQRQVHGQKRQPVGPADQPGAVLAGGRCHHHRRLQGLRRSAAAP
jgi:NCS1 family nucleobase:cation symporter-1